MRSAEQPKLHGCHHIVSKEPEFGRNGHEQDQEALGEQAEHRAARHIGREEQVRLGGGAKQRPSLHFLRLHRRSKLVSGSCNLSDVKTPLLLVVRRTEEKEFRGLSGDTAHVERQHRRSSYQAGDQELG